MPDHRDHQDIDDAKFDRGDGSKSRNVAAVAVQKWLDTVILFLQNFMY